MTKSILRQTMNPLLPVTITVAWLLTVLFAWAFIHGAQILRRQEVAGVISAAQTHEAEQEEPAAAIDPEPARLPHAV